MKNNMGTADRVIRLILASVFAYLYFASVLTGTLALVLLIFAVVFLITGLVGFCPLYRLAGLNTCPVQK